MRLNIALASILLFSSATLISCSGYGSNYTNEDYYEDMFSDWYSSSSYDYYYYSSSSSRYSSSSYYSTDNLVDADTIVKSAADLPDSCYSGDEAYVQQIETQYRCVYGKWFKKLYKVPDCTEDNEWDTYYKSFLYVCQDEDWRIMSETEVELGFCTKQKQGKVLTASDGTSYKCDSLSWQEQTLFDTYGECTTANAGDSIFYGGKSYVCRKDGWSTLTSQEKEFGVCNKSRLGEVVNENNRYYYICSNYSWTSTTDPNDIIGKCDTTKTDSIYRISSSSYICAGGTWRTATTMETYYGICNAKKQDSVRTSGSNMYICDKGEWRIASPEEYYGACTDSLKDILYTYES